jgi:hypothetical protein
MVTQQMYPNYPVLQPDRPLAVQPTTSDQGMVYPGPVTVSNQVYPGLSGLQSNSPIAPSNHTLTVQSFTTPSSEDNEGFRKQYSAPQPHVNTEVDRSQAPGQSREIDIIQTHQRPMPAKRGPFRNQNDRERTAETRRIGSCIRCRMQRIRVGGFFLFFFLPKKKSHPCCCSLSFGDTEYQNPDIHSG